MNSSARLLAVPTLAVGLVLGSAAVATALPAWDIGIYDRCIQNIPDDVLLDNRGTDAVHECCWKSGGSWDSKTNSAWPLRRRGRAAGRHYRRCQRMS